MSIESLYIRNLKRPRIIVQYDWDNAQESNEIEVSFKTLKQKYRELVVIDDDDVTLRVDQRIQYLTDRINASEEYTDDRKAQLISTINTYDYRSKLFSAIKERLVDAAAEDIAKQKLQNYMDVFRDATIELLNAEELPRR